MGTTRVDRRGLIQWAGASALAGLCGGCASVSRSAEAAAFTRDPFTLGVASGDPLADGFVIWTRLAPDPLDAASTPQRAIPVGWEIAEDDAFTRIARMGEATARPENAHAIHVEVEGLSPARPYWYRFHAGGVTSPTGRARTAPVRGASLDALRFAVASCQSRSDGYYAAYRDMAENAPDLVIHVGDYIYTTPWITPARRAPVPEATTLDGYRAVYAAVKSDPDLQAAHAAAPWMVIWDDHEVANDYRGDHPPEGSTPHAWLARRAAAYKAHYEHLPLRRRARPQGPTSALYQRSGFGDLVQFDLLDTRQHRDDHPCRGPAGETPGWIACDAADPGRTMLGEGQEAWLARGYGRLDARWNVIVQTTQLTDYARDLGGSPHVSSDRWSAYPAARDRLLALLSEREAPNPVVLGGDIHAFFAAALRDGATGEAVATELVTGAISSGGGGQDRYDAETTYYAEHAPGAYFDNRSNGYLLCRADREALTTAVRVVDDVRDPDSDARTLAVLTVRDGVVGAITEGG